MEDTGRIEGNMENCFSAPFEIFSQAAFLMRRSMEVAPKISRAALAQAIATQDYWGGVFKYVTAFMGPSVNALNAFANVEKEKLAQKSPGENLKDYSELFNLNVRLASTAMAASLRAMNAFLRKAERRFSCLAGYARRRRPPVRFCLPSGRDAQGSQS